MNLDRITISFGIITFSNIDQQTQAKSIFKSKIPARLGFGSEKFMDSIKALDMMVELEGSQGKLTCKNEGKPCACEDCDFCTDNYCLAVFDPNINWFIFL